MAADAKLTSLFGRDGDGEATTTSVIGRLSVGGAARSEGVTEAIRTVVRVGRDTNATPKLRLASIVATSPAGIAAGVATTLRRGADISAERSQKGRGVFLALV